MLPILLVASANAVPTEIPFWLVLPFGLLLLLIAIMPLIPLDLKHWWEHNYPAVSLGFGILVSVYHYLSDRKLDFQGAGREGGRDRADGSGGG